MKLFFATLLADKGSANEAPGIVIGDCFICRPKLMLALFKGKRNKLEAAMIKREIDFGLAFHFDVPFDKKATNKEYLRYEKMLN